MVELPSEFQMKTKQLLIINQLNKNKTIKNFLNIIFSKNG